MQIRELAIADAWEITPVQWRDERGLFLESFRHDTLEEATGRPFALRQGNTSVSRRGVVRGIHFADTPPGQAKYVSVAHGAGIDFVVDIRVGSPTFGQWDSVLLDAADRRGEGLVRDQRGRIGKFRKTLPERPDRREAVLSTPSLVAP